MFFLIMLEWALATKFMTPEGAFSITWVFIYLNNLWMRYALQLWKQTLEGS